MILFAYGNDSYLLRETVQSWIAQYRAKNKSGLNIIFFSPKTFHIDECRRALLSVSMFSEKKLGVFEGFAGSVHADAILEFIQQANIKDSNEIFFIISEYIEQSDDRRDVARKEAAFEKSKLIAFVNKHAYKKQHVQTPQGGALNAWVQKEFERRDVVINRSALLTFIASMPPNLWIMSSEIEKLSLYKNTIQIQDIGLLVQRHVTTDIFKTIDAMSTRNKGIVLLMLHEHMRKGDAPLQLLSMLVFQFRNIFMAKKLNGAPFPKAAALHPFVQKKAIEQSRNFSLQELSLIYQKLFEVDIAIKTGDIPSEAALDIFVANAL